MSRIAIVFDFETTGLEVEEGAEPIELAAIAVDLGLPGIPEVGRFDARLMRVQKPELANPKALEVNGKTIEQINLAEDPVQVFADFVEWARTFTPAEDLSLPAYKRRRPLLMGHNVKFDIMFLKWAFRQYVPQGMKTYNEVFHYHTRDTLELALFWLVDIQEMNHSGSLVKLTEYFGIPHDAHQAMSDVEACAEVYRRIHTLVKKIQQEASMYVLELNEDTL